MLPGEPRPYVLRSGDGRAHLLIDQVGRVMVGAEESRGALSYTVLDGPAGGPIPFHFHEAEHDFFFCHRGQVQVWAGEESRIMNVGDFASVPPKVPHAYQLHGHYSGFTGPITPGGWDRFFDFCGIPYDGPGYPVDFQPVLPLDKFFEAQEKFAMTLRPRPAVGAGDDRARRRVARRARAVLPARRRGHAPRRRRPAADGDLRRRRVGRRGGDGHARAVQGSGLPAHVHERTHEVLLVLDGRLTVTLDGADHELIRGDAREHPVGHRACLRERGALHEGARARAPPVGSSSC